MSWVEVFDNTREVAHDADGTRRATRHYRVWNYAREQILSAPESILNDDGVGLPSLDSVWEGMRLDAYQVAPNGSVYDVVGLYSNNKSFRFPQRLPDDDLSYTSWSGSVQTGEAEIPFAVYAPAFVSNPSGIVDQLVPGWRFESQRVLNPLVRIERRVTLEAADIPVLIEEATAQTATLHLINAKWYLFEGAEFDEIKPGVYGVRYSWRFDAGTRPMDASGATNIVVPPTVASLIPNMHGGPAWTRPPYHVVTISPNETGNQSDPPVFGLVVPYSYADPTGWSRLPGFVP